MQPRNRVISAADEEKKQVCVRRERGILFQKCAQLAQLQQDKWHAFGKHAILADAALSAGVVVMACMSIALSPSFIRQILP